MAFFDEEFGERIRQQWMSEIRFSLMSPTRAFAITTNLTETSLADSLAELREADPKGYALLMEHLPLPAEDMPVVPW